VWVIKTVQWDGFGDLEPLGARDLAGTLSKLRICEDPCRDEEGRLYVIQSLQETSNSKTIDHKRRPESRLSRTLKNPNFSHSEPEISFSLTEIASTSSALPDG